MIIADLEQSGKFEREIRNQIFEYSNVKNNKIHFSREFRASKDK